MKSFFLSIFLCLCLGQASLAYSYDLPSGARNKLEKILSDKQFHPRGQDKSEFKKTLDEYLNDLITKISEILRTDVSPDSKNLSSGFWATLISALETFSNWFLWGLGLLMKVVLCLSALTLICLVFYRLYKTINKTKNIIEFEEEINRHQSKQRKSFPYLTLLKNGNYKEALIVFHQKIRDDLENTQKISKALTDREALEKIKDEGFIKSLFTRLSIIFEKQVYAGQEISTTSVAKLIKDYESK